MIRCQYDKFFFQKSAKKQQISKKKFYQQNFQKISILLFKSADLATLL
jgi:hypothetical protein